MCKSDEGEKEIKTKRKRRRETENKGMFGGRNPQKIMD